MSVKPIPDGYHSLTPYLTLRGAARGIELYTRAFGGREVFRLPGPGDQVMHAELDIFGSRIMLSDEFPELGAKSPELLGGTSVGFLLYVADVEAVVKQATEAGLQLIRPLELQFYGDRTATLLDPFGHKWTIATHVEDVSAEEMARRMAALG